MRLVPLHDSVWLREYPLRVGGTSIGRRCTIFRLADGGVFVHSTGPFDRADRDEIRSIGPVKAVCDGTLYHDTFAGSVDVLDASAYFIPEGFALPRGVRTPVSPIVELPLILGADFAMINLRGCQGMNEHVFLHRPSRTLVVCDLVFHIGSESDVWTRFFFRYLNGAFGRPAVSRIFRAGIRNREEFRSSVSGILEWDFDTLIMGHGRILTTGAKEALRVALRGL